MSRRLIYPLLALVLAAAIGGWSYLRNQQQQAATAQVESAIQATDQAALFAGIKQGFPEEYAGFLQEITALAQNREIDATLTQEVFTKSQAFTAKLRRENAQYVRTAPLDDIRALRAQTLEILQGLADRPDACARFGARGGSALRPDELNAADISRLTRTAELTFATIVAGRDHPVAHPAPEPGDLAAFLDDWQAQTHPSAAMLTAVNSGAGAPEDLCAVHLSLETFILSDTAPLTERMLVDLTAKSVGG